MYIYVLVCVEGYVNCNIIRYRAREITSKNKQDSEGDGTEL